MTGNSSDDNPYVGPRTYRPDEAYKFFGRPREQRDLTSLIIARRIVLFYAASGAGKSSLLFTKVLPGLEEEGFEILPVGSVSGHDGRDTPAGNIFIYNLLSSLHQQEDEPPGLAQMTLPDFLDRLVYNDDCFYYDDDYEFAADEELKPRVLVVDQFEEILTTNSPFWQQREEFFQQLGQALAIDEQMWLVLTMREDFVAGLDPYLHALPGELRSHYYMQQLNRRAALQAITKPVEDIRPFEEDAADLLVDNLLTIGDDEAAGAHAAQFVEPVQLQAVCYQMWEKLRERPGPTIIRQDVEDFADVDKALAAFYENTIAGTIANTGVAEIELRNWFERELITESGTRNMVYRGDEFSGDLPTPIATYVLQRFILREVVRPGGVWYELVHDRFVHPILESNKAWRLDQPLLRLARRWEEGGRQKEDLLDGRQLVRFDVSNIEALGPLVAEYVTASQTEQAAELEAARQEELTGLETLARSRQRQAVAVAIIGMLAVIMGAFGMWQRDIARNQLSIAESAKLLAVSARQTAEAEANARATESLMLATAEADAVAQAINAATSEAIAVAEEGTAIAARGTAIAARGTAVVEAQIAATSQSEALAQLTISAQALAKLNEISAQSMATITPTLASEGVDESVVILDVPYRSQWDGDAAAASADGGSTSLAMLLNYYGINITPDFVRTEALPPKEPLDFETFSDLIEGARLYNVVMRYNRGQDEESSLESLRESLDEGKPFIALIKYTPWRDLTDNPVDGAHFVLVVGYDDDSVYVHDPLFGLWAPRENGANLKLSTEDFMAGWGGFAVTENPNFAAAVPIDPPAR